MQGLFIYPEQVASRTAMNWTGARIAEDNLRHPCMALGTKASDLKYKHYRNLFALKYPVFTSCGNRQGSPVRTTFISPVRTPKKLSSAHSFSLQCALFTFRVFRF